MVTTTAPTHQGTAGDPSHKSWLPPGHAGRQPTLARVTDPVGSRRSTHPITGLGRPRGSQDTPEEGLAIRSSRHWQEWWLGAAQAAAGPACWPRGPASPQEILSLGGAVPKSRGMDTVPWWDWSPTKALLPMAGSMLTDSPLLAPAGPTESHSCAGQLTVTARQVVRHPGQPGRRAAVRSNSPVLPTGPAVG